VAELAVARRPPLRLRLSRDDLVQGGGLAVLAIFLVVVILLPLFSMLSRSFQDEDRAWIGFANYVEYFSTPTLVTSAEHTLTIGVITTVIVVVLAFIYAYALTRSCMPFKGLFRGIALIPILAPSLLPAISLVYLFGNQGMIKELMFGWKIYGPIGIVISLAFWIFPHAVLILTTALAMADARLYEAAVALRASKLRIFFTVTLPAAKYGTLPAAKYGVMSACFVAFTYSITDFGAPKVIGGWYNVLSVDIYKQVVGQWNFQMGAVVSVVLLFPVVLSFIADRLVQRRQVAQLTARRSRTGASISSCSATACSSPSSWWACSRSRPMPPSSSSGPTTSASRSTTTSSTSWTAAAGRPIGTASRWRRRRRSSGR
jgi:iron(III) transport system permease protein